MWSAFLYGKIEVTYKNEVLSGDIMSKFKYSAAKINQMIEDGGLKKVCMHGVRRDLEKLKPVIEQLYDDSIFYIDYWVSKCPYHGWEWNEDDGRLKSQKDITEGIRQKFMEIYALILAGLGEKCEENN
jgi:5'-deoxynucleotidase YfbR-like HD superfamily hydrolase